MLDYTRRKEFKTKMSSNNLFKGAHKSYYDIEENLAFIQI